MMRISVPESEASNPAAYIAKTYATDIVGASIGFYSAVYRSSKLSLREFEAARIRTAQINGCIICQNFRAERDLPNFMQALGGDAKGTFLENGPAPDELFYEQVSEWRNSESFSEREQLAIQYAEGFAIDPKGVARDDPFWSRMRTAFTDDQIVDLSYCIASWMGLGRVAHVLGFDTVCAIEPAALAPVD